MRIILKYKVKLNKYRKYFYYCYFIIYSSLFNLAINMTKFLFIHSFKLMGNIEKNIASNCSSA